MPGEIGEGDVETLRVEYGNMAKGAGVFWFIDMMPSIRREQRRRKEEAKSREEMGNWGDEHAEFEEGDWGGFGESMNMPEDGEENAKEVKQRDLERDEFTRLGENIQTRNQKTEEFESDGQLGELEEDGLARFVAKMKRLVEVTDLDDGEPKGLGMDIKRLNSGVKILQEDEQLGEVDLRRPRKKLKRLQDDTEELDAEVKRPRQSVEKHR